MENDIIQRITAIINYKSRNESDFANIIGIAQTSLNNYMTGRRKISFDVIKKISTSFGDISLDWLITGKGAMLKVEAPALIPSASSEEGTPLLPVEAWGGSLAGSSIAVLAEQCKKYNVPISNIDYLIPIAGDSMMPDYCPGDIVAIKKINERAFIEWGKVYVLDTCNGVVIKEIQPSKDEGCITCVSRNKPEKYRPFEVNLDPEEFYGMYAVKGTVRLS